MIAVLGWCDGFGNDTYVAGIFPNLKKAEEFSKEHDDKIQKLNHYPHPSWGSEDYRWVEFDYGEVDFDYYDANEFKKRKGRK